MNAPEIIAGKLRAYEQTKRTIPYYGNFASLMEKNLKLSTLRRSSAKYRGIQPGDMVLASCDDGKVPAVVWGVQEDVPLKDIHPALLGFDGFFSRDTAIEVMSGYPGYGDLALSSPMIVLATIAEENFFKLTPEQQLALLDQQEGIDLTRVIVNPLLRSLMRNSLLFWYHDQVGNRGAETFLQELGLRKSVLS